MLLRTQKRVLGLDSSTNSLAYAILDDGRLISYGEIVYSGVTLHDRLLDANLKIEKWAAKVDVDKVFIEETVTVRSANTGIKMALFASVPISIFLKQGKEVKTIVPITWQSYIGNKVLTAIEKKSFKVENPGKTMSWYQSRFRSIRKKKTADWVKDTFGVDIKSDNVTDAIGIAWTGYHK